MNWYFEYIALVSSDLKEKIWFGIYVCKVVVDMINEEVKENNMVIAMRMLEDGKLSVEEIAKYLGLSEDEVKSLLEE